MKNIEQLIEFYLSHNNLHRKDLVVRMGYKNITKGLRRLDACIKLGECSEIFKNLLANALNITLTEIEQAIGLLRSEIRKSELKMEKSRFRPHIKITHAGNRPLNITAVAFFGIKQFKEIAVDENLSRKTLWEQIEIVQDLVKNHYAHANGTCPMFGVITGYRYFYQFDEWVAFSTDGSILNYESGQCKNAQVVLKIGRKKISDGLFR